MRPPWLDALAADQSEVLTPSHWNASPGRRASGTSIPRTIVRWLTSYVRAKAASHLYVRHGRGIFDRHEAAPPLGGFSPPGLVFSQPALLGWTVDFSRKRAGGGRRATASQSRPCGRPPNWTDWSADAEGLHGISREKLADEGVPISIVVREMMATLSNMISSRARRHGMGNGSASCFGPGGSTTCSSSP